ncbi:MAG: tRNA lysidine(34) synthetase TilS [Chloroflexota bacterium]
MPAGQHRDEIVAEVRARLDHLGHGAPVLVACSGGPDSTALAFLAEEARPDLVFTLVHVAHGLRDDDADARLVAQHATWLGAGCVHRRIEVVRDHRGLEAAARDGRYTALREAASDVGAATILVGHTAEDQAETVLLRIARGTGVDGLAAMATHAHGLTRPMLALRRQDVRGFAVAQGIPTAHDPMNEDPAVRRIVVREQVLPALGLTAADPVGALGRLAQLARGDAELLDEVARDHIAVLRVADALVLSRAQLRRARTPVARRVIHRALRGVVGRAPSAATVHRVLDADTGQHTTLPGGVELEVTARWVGLARPIGDCDTVALPTPGEAAWPAAGRWIHVLRAGEDTAVQDAAFASGRPVQAALPLPGAWTPPPFTADPLALPPGGRLERLEARLPADLGDLSIRAVRPGDRIVDDVGRRRVVEVFRNAALVPSVRRRWPVVVAGDRVAWIPGYAVDAELSRMARRNPQVVLRMTHTTRCPSADAPGHTAR